MTPQNFETAFERIRSLASDFQKHERAYLASAYSEQDVRKDFIDKFWIALGWDVNHELQKNPYEQEVKVERNVDVKGRKKKADYAFLAPNFRDVRFFVEAKKPARNIDNPDYYFQTIRYGWNSGAPLSILTDFEQLRVLDCRYKPDVQNALNRALKKFHYTEYIDEEKFKEIYFLFSREAVMDGSLEKYAATLPKPTGRATQRGLFGGSYKSVDEDFLAELDELRDELARSFKNRNQRLNGEELTEATQRTLDRLVFMRFLEDKLIEPEVIVEKLGERGTAWADFISESERLNGIYNGIIFRHHTIIDKADFAVDERVFADVRERLAHTNSPYNFDALPVHILGSIYERFLGKVIVTTDKRAKVVEKPEVRKAGGVYYTPAYIVRYIVENTVGKLVEGKTPDEIAELRFADIACGSGSFLLGVFDELLRYHTAYYNRNKTKRAEGLRAGCIENEDGSLRLSLKQKKKILLKNIYGVDLDAQAVEVAQLSLFLKLLEDETTASAKGHQLEFRETMLPSLDKNVIHGNSLIGWDIGGGLFGDEEERKLFPMDFEQAFPEVMRRGGFDAIVGNPPWGAEFNETSLVYLRDKNKEVINRMIDSFMYFVYQGCKKLKSGGRLGMILPDVILYQQDNKKLRQFLLENYSIKLILNMGDVFQKVTRPSSILVVEDIDSSQNKMRIANLSRFNKTDKPSAILNFSNIEEVQQNDIHNIPGKLFVVENIFHYTLWSKVNSVPHVLLGNLVDEDGIQRGVSPDLKKAFLIDSDTAQKYQLETDKLKKALSGGKQVKRYFIDYPDLLLIYTKHSDNFSKSPHIRAYIEQYKSEITCKEVTQKKHSLYALHRPRKESIFLKSRKLVGVITEDEIVVALDTTQSYATDGLYLFGVREQINDLYLMAILNSKLFVFIYRLLASETGRVLAQVKPTTLAQLPIRTINFSDKADRARHDRMVSLVEQMLAAKRQLQTARTDRDRNFYENKCAALDRQIDSLVYELYELTPEEIAIIEGRSS